LGEKGLVFTDLLEFWGELFAVSAGGGVEVDEGEGGLVYFFVEIVLVQITYQAE